MTVKKKFKSEAFESIHSAAKALHDVGAIDKMTMRNYDVLCIQKPSTIEPTTIKSLRESFSLSQPLFAEYLNVSKSTVEKWESGDKRPSGAANRLLAVVQKHGLKVLS